MGVNVPIEDIAAQLDKVGPIAEKAGEEAGKAFAKGASGGAKAGGIDGKALWTEMGGDQAKAAVDKLVSDDAANKAQAAASGSSGGTGAGLMAAGAVAAMIATAEKFEAIGEKIGSALFEGTKQQLELQQAIRMLNDSLQTQIELQRKQFEARTGNNKNVSPAMEDRKQKLEAETQALEEEQASIGFGDILEGAASFAIRNPFGGQRLIKTTRMQRQEQIDENKDRLNILRGGSTGIAGNQRANFNTGGILESELGLPPNSVGNGESLSPGNAEIFRDFVHQNQAQARDMARWQSLSYQQQQEEIHNRTTTRMQPIR